MTRLPATRLYYGLEFLLSMPAWVVLSLYLVRDLHFSPLQLVLVGTAMEATVFVFEVPTGVIADTYSRRLSLVIGFVGMGAAIVGVGFASSATAIIALWAGWGLAYTFTSGAYEAWIADEVGAENVAPVFLRGARISFGGALLGLAVFAAIGVVSLREAVIAQGSLQLACGLGCIALMPETGFRRRPREERGSPLRELRTTAGGGMRFVRARRVVGMLVATELFAGFGAEAFDRLREAHVLRDVGFPGSVDPVVWFAVIGAVALVFGFVVVGRVIRRVERVGPRSVATMLAGFTALFVAAQLLFAFAGGFALVIAALVVTLIARSLVGPLYSTWLNQQITDSSVRATVLSISGQANAIGQASGGPLLGAVGNAFGIPAALAAGALTLLPALGLYGRALRHGGVEPELDRLPEPVSPAAV